MHNLGFTKRGGDMFCTFTLFSCWEEFCLLSLGGVVYFALSERTLHPVPPHPFCCQSWGQTLTMPLPMTLNCIWLRSFSELGNSETSKLFLLQSFLKWFIKCIANWSGVRMLFLQKWSAATAEEWYINRLWQFVLSMMGLKTNTSQALIQLITKARLLLGKIAV